MVVEKLVTAVKEGAVPIAIGAGLGAATGALVSRFVPTVPTAVSALTGAVVGGGIGYMASESIVPGTGKTAIIGASLPVAAAIAALVAPAITGGAKSQSQTEYIPYSVPVYQQEIEEEARRKLVTVD
jgi:hypothetical protein